jgi:pyruvate,orthophosphate dikinase
MDVQFNSDALRANLEQTKTENDIFPKEYIWFINLSKDHYGINNRAKEFSREYHHKFVNYNYLLEVLHDITVSDTWFYKSLGEKEKALSFFITLFSQLLEKNLNRKQKEYLIKMIFKFIDKLLKEEKSPAENEAFEAFKIIKNNINENLEIYLFNNNYFKTYLNRAAKTELMGNEVFYLTQEVLYKGIEYWENSIDITKIAGFKKDFFKELKTKIHNCNNWKELLENPFFNDIANYLRKLGDNSVLPIEKFHYLFYIMHLSGMRPLENHLLYDINRLLRDIIKDLDHEEIISFTSISFELFKEFKELHTSTILDCIVTLGKEISSTGDLNLINHFITNIIDFGFIYPGKISVSSDWQVISNKNHVKNIRVWLELIETSPKKFKKLLSALIVNLKLGGIFISDTDLFQRDITKLLNSDITPMYKQIKKLARIFPVYFKEVGAEGKLREVTTAMDELCGRKDILVHFIRKQVHAESNNTQIYLAEKTAKYWLTGEKDSLLKYLPEDVASSLSVSSRYYYGINQIMKDASKHFGKNHIELLQMPKKEILPFIENHPLDNKKDKKRLGNFFQLYSLLVEKYSLESTDLVSFLAGSNFFSKEDIENLNSALINNTKEALIELFKMLEKLKVIINDPAESVAFENIYYKRHIAVGIPSMYGQYSEKKFEALGVTYRLETAASKLMEKILSELKLEYITAKTLRDIYEILNLFKTGLELDGVENQDFKSNLDMFYFSLNSSSFTLNQYMNIFRFMALNIKEIINEYFMRFYDEALSQIIPQLYDDSEETQLKKSEEFYREVLSLSFLIQQLDYFVSNCISKLSAMLDNYSEKYISNMMTYNPDLAITSFDTPNPQMDNRVFLGAKAYYLKKLTSYGLPVPPGFVLTTEVFRHRDTVLDHPYMSLELESFIFREIKRIEKISSKKFGNVNNPLFLSVRSGTAISLPGAMNTVLNVGINDLIAEKTEENIENAWMIWDSYRRFIQSWGMINGIERNVFDKIINEFKLSYSVEKKADFTSRQMKDLVKEYKIILHDYNILIHQDPYIQLRQALNIVLDSWDTERAQAYREHLQIAEEWGTAVIIQKMVMGNKSKFSGSGVVFTHNPKLSKPGINLYGDFTPCSQGEDIVAGLVHPLPVSESQRLDNYSDAKESLESAFPEIYKQLFEYSKKLIYDFGFSNQEIEFTFESGKPEDLYILQTREQIITPKEKTPVFCENHTKMKFLGQGIGIGNDCLTGRIAFDKEDLLFLKEKYPKEKQILVRPDTIPDDIPKILICHGLITSRGGVTSHAAVTAGKLKKVCIVNCKDLVVKDKEKECLIGRKNLKLGDIISIDGKTGNIYLGEYKIMYI